MKDDNYDFKREFGSMFGREVIEQFQSEQRKAQAEHRRAQREEEKQEFERRFVTVERPPLPPRLKLGIAIAGILIGMALLSVFSSPSKDTTLPSLDPVGYRAAEAAASKWDIPVTYIPGTITYGEGSYRGVLDFSSATSSTKPPVYQDTCTWQLVVNQVADIQCPLAFPDGSSN